MASTTAKTELLYQSTRLLSGVVFSIIIVCLYQVSLKIYSGQKHHAITLHYYFGM